MRTFTSAADKQVSQRLLKACTAIIDQYRKEVGHLPVWLDELEATDALKLLTACTRVGMKLPQHETLADDQKERDLAIADVCGEAEVLLKAACRNGDRTLCDAEQEGDPNPSLEIQNLIRELRKPGTPERLG